MKKLFVLFGLSTLLIAGCNGVQENVFVNKNIDVYSMLDIGNTNYESIYDNPIAVKEHTFKGQTTFKIHKDYKNILYTDFKTYCNLLTYGLPSAYKCAITSTSLEVKNDKGDLTFKAGVKKESKEFYYAGQMSLGTIDSPSSAGSLLIDLKLNQKIIKMPTASTINSSYATFEKDLPIYDIDGEFTAPLGLFDSAFGAAVSAYHIYDGSRLLQYNNKKALGCSIGETTNSFVHSMYAFYQQNGMPLDMRLLDKACIYFSMDAYYGLKAHRGIESMSNYFDNLGFDESLLEEDDARRSYNYFGLFAALDDDHSGINMIADWYGDDKATSHRSQRSNDRMAINRSLSAQRDYTFGTTRTAYGFDEQVHYSESEETAYFYFDSFNFDFNNYDPANRDNLWKTDAYFYFVHQFNEIVNHGGVKNVIIDDSCNGGGTVGIALKLLALISKDNNGKFYQQDIVTGAVSELSGRVDSNADGKYDQDDVFGDDFNIAVLTSPSSFSCGNLFPICAQNTGDAKIIGQRSGGGECTVSSRFFPSGRGYQFSSTTRLCYYENNEVTYGIELGVNPDITIPYYQFYDLDLLEGLLK